MLSAKVSGTRCAIRAPSKSRASVRVFAAAWTRVLSKDALTTAGGKTVVEIGGNKILLAEQDGEVMAVSNKCTHLGLPLVGKTALFQGKVVNNCIVCPAHNTAFSLKTGEVVGEWCPKFPDLPFVGKVSPSKPLPTFQVRVTESGDIEVLA